MLTQSTKTLKLAHLQPIAGGAQCSVFVHPDDPALLVKIMRDRRSAMPWYKRQWARSGHMLPVIREIEEYVVLHAHAPADAELVERVVGVVVTDLGLGLVVEALRDREGRLAPALRQLIASGAFDDAMTAKLDRFIARVVDSKIILYDISSRNILHAYDPASGEDRFVLVDGIGEKLTFSLNPLFQPLNRFNKKRRIRRLWRRLKMPPRPIGSG
jgi:hypothetical protein